MTKVVTVRGRLWVLVPFLYLRCNMFLSDVSVSVRPGFRNHAAVVAQWDHHGGKGRRPSRPASNPY